MEGMARQSDVTCNRRNVTDVEIGMNDGGKNFDQNPVIDPVIDQTWS